MRIIWTNWHPQITLYSEIEASNNAMLADPKKSRWAGIPIEFEFKMKTFAPPKYKNAKNTVRRGALY